LNGSRGRDQWLSKMRLCPSAEQRRQFMRSIASLSTLIAVALLLSAVPWPFSTSPEETVYATSAEASVTDSVGNIVVELRDAEAYRNVIDFAASRGIEVPFCSEETGILTLRSAGLDRASLEAISEMPGVTSISPERKVRALFTPNDQYLSSLWGLDTVNAYEAWDIAQGTHDVIVGVLDTGIDWNHPDLSGNIWSDPSGYHGYNFIDYNRIPMDDNVNSYDENGEWIPNTYTYHGTHVAGVIGATINNNLGVAGIAQARLMAVKVMNDSGEGTDATVAAGIRWAVDNGAVVVTMSLGVDGMSTTLENAVDYASSRGVVTVAATGNSGSSYVSYPAAYPSVIAVGAIDSTDRRASFSNFGTGLDVMAPGVQIYSTQGGGGYQYLSGTSTAAPYVAGVAAIMLSVNPALSPVEVGNVINSTARDISRTGYDTSTGWGIVDAFRAVEQIASPTVTVTERPEYATPNGTYSITWMVSGGDPGVIQTTYLMWGTSATSLTQRSQEFNGTTWETFTVSNLPSLPGNGTIYLKAYANVDGTMYESALVTIPVHEPTPDGFFAQFLRDVHNFIFNDLGLTNFLLLMAVLIAIPAIVIVARPKRRRTVVSAPRPQLQHFEAATPVQYLPPPPPPPPRYETYVDLVGHEVMPSVVRVIEGTKVVWVNRTWAPPPGIAIKSGRVDEAGEHPDGMFQSGLLIAPGDYWSATFHRVGEYSYYLTGIWKMAKIVVEPYRAAAPSAS